MKIAVLGGAGFIGSHVVDELIFRGYEPVVFDHHKHKLYKDVEIFQGDVRDRTAVTELMAHVDGWINLAACLGTQETINNPYPALETNVLGGINVLEAASQYDVPGVYIAVGNWWFDNPYSITKNMVERFTRMYNEYRGTRVNIVRACNAYGPRQLATEPFAHGKVRKITPSLICRALSGMPMELYGGGAQVSDMISVLDVAKALVNALEEADRGNVFPEAVEIGPALSTTIRQVAELVNNIAGSLGYEQVEITSLPMRPGERVGEAVTADTRTLELVGMSANKLIPLEIGMRETIEWYIANEGVTWTKPN